MQLNCRSFLASTTGAAAFAGAFGRPALSQSLSANMILNWRYQGPQGWFFWRRIVAILPMQRLICSWIKALVWRGHGLANLTAMIICIFPIVMNLATGLATVEPDLADVMKSKKASKRDILWHSAVPRAMPYCFAALKITAGNLYSRAISRQT